MKSMAPDEWGIKELQNCILNIAKDIHEFCQKYGIDYCLAGGSALGAVRHGGFIPWDDDLDLFMTPENYEKFRDCFYRYGNKDKYYLQQGFVFDGMVNWAKVRLNKSTYIEDAVKELDIHHGIFVDIFILHNCPESKLKQFWMSFWEKYITTKEIINRNYMKRGWLLNAVFKCLKILPKKFLIKYALKQVYKYRNVKSKYKCHLYDKKPIKTGIYPVSFFEENKLTTFENTKLILMGNADGYLKTFYGDYMKIPSLRDIKFKQHSVEWSVDVPYHLRGKGTFADE